MDKIKPSIYIVEDNADIGFIMELYLQEEGFNVKLLPSAAELYQALKIELPDLFILDVRLPDGNGLEICRQLKKNSRSRLLPVLIMSAHADEDVAKKFNADDFLAKPFGFSFLLGKINQHLPAFN